MKKLLLSISFLSLGLAANAQTWVSQATGFEAASRGVEEINIVDANTVWALAFDGTSSTNVIQEFTLTTNGGTTWTPGVIDIGNPAVSINNISPVSATTAWISAVNGTDGSGSCIFKTTDGGATWDQQNTAGYTSSTSFINYVHFFNENVGISAGDPANGEFEIYRTTDGGANWTLVPGANIPNPLSNEWGYNGGNSAIGNNAWIVTNKGRILKTTDMGLTWTVSQAPLTDFGSALPANSGRLIFSDANNGCLLKTSGTAAVPVYTFYTTTNGGTTWSAGTAFTGTYRLLTYIPGTTTIVATSAGTPSGSAYSNNNGTTWTTIDSGAQRGVPAFFNATTGWCGGYSSTPFTDGIFKIDGNLATAQYSATKFKVYPNPANSVVTVATEGLDSYTLKVTDLTGKVMTTRDLSGVENTIDISGYAAGVYFFEINSGNKSESIKIIKN